MYYEMHQYQQSEIKHLQARVNLLSEENQLLKKMLLCTPQRASQLCIDK
jgi:cell shape-determining protein MreC